MSTDEGYIDCELHGKQQETFVCQHIIQSLQDGKPRGFISAEETSENPRPDSWCNECEGMLKQVDEWNEESEAFAGVKLLCGACYDNALELNTGFGATLFGGSQFIRKSLVPFILLFAVIMVFLSIKSANFQGIIIVSPLILCCILLLLVLYNPIRFHWASRCITTMVFLGYSYYLYDSQFIYENSSSSPIQAILGFIFIGFPSLVYTCTGKFSLFKRN